MFGVIFLIPVTCIFDQVFDSGISQGDIRCLSLLGLEGLMPSKAFGGYTIIIAKDRQAMR